MPERTDKPHKIAEALRAVSGNLQHRKFTSAIILAAGSSTRMGRGKTTKQFLELDGIPIVARTIIQFENAECIDEIVVVAKKEEVSNYDDFCKKYKITKPFRVVAGGETRQQSAMRGVECASKESGYVCIHDAARCLITPEDIVKVCRGAYLHGAATLATKAVDTVKISDKNAYIESTPQRKSTWLAQTPQVFRKNAYYIAAYIAREEEYNVTDDCSLMEHIKNPVKLIEGSRENIKITDQLDLVFAKAVLDLRKTK